MALAIDADGDGQVGFENLGHRVNDALSMIEDESMTSSQVLLPLGDDSVSEISMLLPPELARGGCQVLNLFVSCCVAASLALPSARAALSSPSRAWCCIARETIDARTSSMKAFALASFASNAADSDVNSSFRGAVAVPTARNLASWELTMRSP